MLACVTWDVRFQYACAARACSIDTLPYGADRYTPVDFPLTVWRCAYVACLRGMLTWHADVALPHADVRTWFVRYVG